MAAIRFEDLLLVYRNTEFAAGDDADADSKLLVTSPALIDLLARIEGDDDAAVDTGITLLDDLEQVVVDSKVRVRVGAPRTGLGILARSIDQLIAKPSSRIEEPLRYYLIDPPFSPGDAPVPEAIGRYRKVLELVGLFGEAASFLDKTRAELVFVKDGRMVVPVLFKAADLASLAVDQADRLLSQFGDELHREQKLEILFEALWELCRAQPTADRFSFVLRNLVDLTDAVRDGFKLFASKFSYSKIRSEIEDARVDYTQKIHKTIVDIQNQLLGIPVATVIVASQMKAPTACGPELWANLAILLGAWLFVGLLMIAICNQWVTLNVIKSEVTRQKRMLVTDFPKVSGDFVRTFDSLNRRIRLHHCGLIAIGLIGLAGAIAATYLHNKMAVAPVQACTSDGSEKPVASPSPTPAAGLAPSLFLHPNERT